MKINILKLSRRKILLVLSSLIVLTTFIFVVPKAYSYYQASQLELQGDIFLAQSKYQEAFQKYRESQNKWDDVEINKKISKAQILVESEESYQTGLEAFNKEKYEKAIEAFLNVDSEYREYDKARNMLEEAKEKIKEPGRVVKTMQAGLKQETAPSPAPLPTPTSISIPTTAPKQDNTSKLMAMKNLFQKIANLNKEIIFAAHQIDNISKEYSGTLSSGDLLDLLKPYGETIESSKKQISDIDRQIQDIIASCDGMECEQLYQEFVTRMKSEGYVAR